VGLTDVTLHLLKGRADFDPPAKELHWKERYRTHLVMTPKAWVPIEQLKQEVDQAEGAAKTEAQCMQLGDKMKALFVPDDELDITPLDQPTKEIQPEKPHHVALGYRRERDGSTPSGPRRHSICVLTIGGRKVSRDSAEPPAV
jgi:hypothetical protein